MMKKALILAATAFALCGCFKIEEDDVFTEILFDAAAYKATDTKAGPIEGAYYDYSCPEFTVYLSHVGQGMTWGANHASSQFYAKAVCSADSANEIWTSTPVTYWPLSGSLTFVGFTPNTVTSSFDKGTLTCNYDITGQDDIMFSAAKDAMDLTVDNYKSSSASSDYTPDGSQSKNTTGVPIIFRHALSQVLVKVDANSELNGDIKFKVSSLNFKERKKADMTVVSYGENPTISWTLSETDGDIKHSIISADQEIKKGGTTFTSDSDAEKSGNQGILVFPQNAQTPKLVITYTQYQFTGLMGSSDEYSALSDDQKTALTVDSDGKVWSNGGEVTRTIDLNTTTLTSFEPGKKYVLQITLTAAQILYSPSVIDWDTFDADSSTSGTQNPNIDL